jgi:hypothetical protein
VFEQLLMDVGIGDAGHRQRLISELLVLRSRYATLEVPPLHMLQQPFLFITFRRSTLAKRIPPADETEFPPPPTVFCFQEAPPPPPLHFLPSKGTEGVYMNIPYGGAAAMR